jgi:hypothetical protein
VPLASVNPGGKVFVSAWVSVAVSLVFDNVSVSRLVAPLDMLAGEKLICVTEGGVAVCANKRFGVLNSETPDTASASNLTSRPTLLDGFGARRSSPESESHTRFPIMLPYRLIAQLLRYFANFIVDGIAHIDVS